MSVASLIKPESAPIDFVGQLLAEQSQLTAVEEFSAQHDHLTDVQVQPAPDENLPAQARYYKALLPTSQPTSDSQYAFEVDLDACSGCKACVVACHTLNGLDEDESWRRVGSLTVGSQLPQIKHVTTACHHCADPGCLNGCPVKAYDKDPVTGIVKHLDDQCIGCKYCMMMCPYEVPVYNKRLGIVRKCDMCSQRLHAGEAPACVQSCPNGAIAIRLIEASELNFNSDDKLTPGAPSSAITRPSTRFTGMHAQDLAAGIPQDSSLDHAAENHWPLAVMLVATQISVGLLVAERCASGFMLLANRSLPQTVTWTSYIVALLIASVGMAVAPLHLGQPTRAWRVFLGLRTSWLSREAVLLGKYMACLGATVGLLSIQPLGDWIPSRIHASLPVWASQVGMALSLLFGVLGLLSSGMIYVATQRQLWRMSRTMLRFMGSASIGGCISLAAVTSFWQETSWVTVCALTAGGILAAAKFAWEWVVLIGNPHRDHSKYDSRSRKLYRESLSQLRLGRILCGVTVPALCVAAGVYVIDQSHALAPLLCVSAAGAALAGELLERLSYFSSVVFDRMPGVIR